MALYLAARLQVEGTGGKRDLTNPGEMAWVQRISVLPDLQEN